MAITVQIHDPEHGTRRLDPVDDASLRRALADRSAVVWIRVEGSDDDAPRIMRDVLELHPLSIEDVWHDTPHPKVEDFGRYLYLVVHGIDQKAESPFDLDTVELDLFLGASWVLTHEARPMRSVEAVAADVERGTKLLERGAAWVAHALLDHLTDHYAPVMDAFDDVVDEIETEVVTHPTRQSLTKIFAVKRSLMRLRRVAMHQKEILLRLSRGEFELLPPSTQPFFRDVHDHFVRVADLADSYRDLVSGALDAYLSTTSNRMNEIMKVLTGFSTVMLPLTFIAGVYGMNFERMPELKWAYGYPFAIALMVVTAAVILVYFRRKKWF